MCPGEIFNFPIYFWLKYFFIDVSVYKIKILKYEITYTLLLKAEARGVGLIKSGGDELSNPQETHISMGG